MEGQLWPACAAPASLADMRGTTPRCGQQAAAAFARSLHAGASNGVLLPVCRCVADVLPSVTTLPELSLDKMAATSRPHVAAGFALLQLQRNQIVVGVEDLSTAPDWQVKAYQCLKVLLPMMNSNVMPDHLDFVIFHYFSEVVSFRFWLGALPC